MQTFQVMKKSFAVLGINKEVSTQEHLINPRNMATLFMLSGAAVLNGVHLYYEAETFKDYAVGIYSGSSLIVAAILFTVTILNQRRTNKCLKSMEKLVNKSKFHIASHKLIASIQISFIFFI